MNTEDKTAIFAAFLLAPTSAVEITLPNGQPMLYQGQPVRVHVYGPASQVFIDAKAELDRDAAQRVFGAMNKGQGNNKRGTPEGAETDAKFLTAITRDIENFPYPGGVAAVYREPGLLYLHDQVRRHLGDLGNFFGHSETA
jgi:hypothetical protein